MHDVTSIQYQPVELADGAAMRVGVRGNGTHHVLLLQDVAPHATASLAADPLGLGDAWDEEFRTVVCDQRWAGTGSAGIVPFDHELATSDLEGALDAVALPQVDVVALGAGVPRALALAAHARSRVASMVLVDPMVLGPDRSWDHLAETFDEAMRFVRAEGFEGLEKQLANDPDSPAAGPYGPQLAASGQLVESLEQMGRERYIARVVAYRDGLYPDQPLLSITDEEAVAVAESVGHRTLVVPHPDRPASAEVLAARLPQSRTALPAVPEGAALWRTVVQFLQTDSRPA